MILVVDDDAAVRNSLKFSLEVEGFSVRAYSRASDLLAEVDMPDRGCLVLDYRLPGASGLDLLDELRSRKVRLPAVLITSHPSMKLRERAAAAGVPVVEKPLLTESLFESICTALEAKPQP